MKSLFTIQRRVAFLRSSVSVLQSCVPAFLPGLVLVACSAVVLTQAAPRARDTTWEAPPSAAARVNPLTDREEVASGGAKIYRQRCATCHGDSGEGRAKAPSLHDAAVQAQTDGALFWKISSGNSRAGMPAFSLLPEPQRWQLVMHVRALSR